jgi:hypothetical protein
MTPFIASFERFSALQLSFDVERRAFAESYMLAFEGETGQRAEIHPIGYGRP